MIAVTAKALSWTEAGMVPDTVIRHGIRRLLDRELRKIRADDVEHVSGVKISPCRNDERLAGRAGIAFAERAPRRAACSNLLRKQGG